LRCGDPVDGRGLHCRRSDDRVRRPRSGRSTVHATAARSGLDHGAGLQPRGRWSKTRDAVLAPSGGRLYAKPSMVAFAPGWPASTSDGPVDRSIAHSCPNWPEAGRAGNLIELGPRSIRSREERLRPRWWLEVSFAVLLSVPRQQLHRTGGNRCTNSGFQLRGVPGAQCHAATRSLAARCAAHGGEEKGSRRFSFPACRSHPRSAPG
jgi:hypothetical protein